MLDPRELDLAWNPPDRRTARWDIRFRGGCADGLAVPVPAFPPSVFWAGVDPVTATVRVFQVRAHAWLTKYASLFDFCEYVPACRTCDGFARVLRRPPSRWEPCPKCHPEPTVSAS